MKSLSKGKSSPASFLFKVHYLPSGSGLLMVPSKKIWAGSSEILRLETLTDTSPEKGQNSSTEAPRVMR